MRRAIISGITGHLGSELATQLAAVGFEVHGITRQDTTLPRRWGGTANLHRIDGRTKTLIAIFNEVRPDTVFHLAGLSRREHRSTDVVPFVEANILFGTQLLEAMRSSSCSRFVSAGSYLQHFNTDGYRAFNLYAATKQAFEDLLSYYVDAAGISAIRLTLCDVYSENDTRPKLMTDMAVAWRTHTPLVLHADRAVVDLIHVEDAAAAFLQADSLLEVNATPDGALSRYSVSSGYHMSATELVSLFEKIGCRRLAVVRSETSNLARRMRPWRGAILPGWTPRVTLETGISRIIAKQ